MERKQKRREMIDEDYIRTLIGGVDAPPKLVPKQAPAESSPKTPPQEVGDRSRQAVAPTDKEKGANRESYERLFLQPRKYKAQKFCRIDCELWHKLNLINDFLGHKKTSVPGLVNNIIYEHLENYRDEINEKLNQLTKNI